MAENIMGFPNPTIQDRIENDNDHPVVHLGNGIRLEIGQPCDPPPFERLLHGLLTDDFLLRLEAKTPQNIQLYKSVLARWKEAGYPHPGGWPRNIGHLSSAYTKEWMEKHSVHGF